MKKIFTKQAVKGVLLLIGFKNNEEFYNFFVEDFYENQQKFIDYLNDTFGKNIHYFK